ncbi:MAG TPA: PRC-barrel domain-containing protein [Longimicrobiaceae bacterium]|nr:PRC-barrel domain-containing protein [Longimicrobiaceae bacterium]
MANGSGEHVVPLSQFEDFEVAGGDPDVRGWEVIGADGRTIGRVDQLLIDTLTMKVRYLDVEVNRSLLDDGTGDRHVLIPIVYARLDKEDDSVCVDAIASTGVATLPEYTHGPMTRDFETTLRRHFDRQLSGGGPRLPRGGSVRRKQ